MRQWLAITVILLIGLPVFAPLFPGTTVLPVCCRRAGQHHCMNGMMPLAGANNTSSHEVTLVAPMCPRCPMATVMPPTMGFLPLDGHNTGIALYVRPTSLPQTEARYRIAFARSRQKRGPPAFFS